MGKVFFYLGQQKQKNGKGILADADIKQKNEEEENKGNREKAKTLGKGSSLQSKKYYSRNGVGNIVNVNIEEKISNGLEKE